MVTATKKTNMVKASQSKESEQDKAHIEAMKNLQMSCQEVRYSISWLPTSKRASDHAKNKMVDAVGGKKKGYSVTKRLFSSDHPLISELNAARRRIDEWRDSFTIVKSAEVDADSEGRTKIESGVRLIRNDDIEEFDRGFRIRVEQMLKAADAVQAHLRTPYTSKGKSWPSVIDMDKERLGREFDEKDYPDNVADCLRVELPRYQQYTVSTLLPKEVYERESKRLQEALNGTIETAVNYLTDTLNTTFETLARQLVNRTRVYPDQKGKYAKYYEAEVMSRVENKQDPDVPEGSIVVELRYKETTRESGTKERSRSVTETVGPISLEEFQKELKPQTTNEKKKITTSVIDHMIEQLGNFSKLKTMLGEHGSRIDQSLDKVRTLLSSVHNKPEDVAAEIRSSMSFRNNLASTLSTVCTDLFATAEEVKKVRRRISSKQISDYHESKDE